MPKEEYRDVHGSSDNHQHLLKQIQDSSMSDRQKLQIYQFVEALRLGKDGQKVRDKRLNNYLQFFTKLNTILKKDFDTVTEEETTKLYKDLMENKIRKDNGMPYADNTKTAFIRTLKRFLGWKWGKDNELYKKSIRWAKDFDAESHRQAITLEEATKCAEQEPDIRNKCLFMFGFDSGGRIEELLNVKIGDLKTNAKGEGKYYIVHLRGEKTEEADRTIPVPIATKYLKAWLDVHPTKEDNDFLFPIEYDNARKIIRVMSLRALKKKVTPHELRHSSATHYIQHGGFGAENIGGFYYRYGWKFGSKQALVYIKMHLYGGELGHEKVVKHIIGENVERMELEMKAMKERLKNLEPLERYVSELKKDKKKQQMLVNALNKLEGEDKYSLIEKEEASKT